MYCTTTCAWEYLQPPCPDDVICSSRQACIAIEAPPFYSVIMIRGGSGTPLDILVDDMVHSSSSTRDEKRICVRYFNRHNVKITR